MNSSASSGGAFWKKLTDPEQGIFHGSLRDLRVVLLAAHQDDETIGASLALATLPNSTVVFLTDGAPRDTQLWSAGVLGSREEYAHLRAKEAEQALSRAGVAKPSIRWLGAVDQEASTQIGGLVDKFLHILRECLPDIVISHPYEGGHPDHDATALIAKLAIESFGDLEKIPELLEMTSYHVENGQCVTGKFLPSTSSPPELALDLSAADRQRKREMLDCYKSQRLVLETFGIDSERLRPAPDYDFSQPPHQGKLWYECLGWPMTGERWRKLASQALLEVHQQPCR